MLDKIVNLIKNGERGLTLSKFLTINEQIKLRNNQLNILFCDNYPEEERKRALIFPKDIDIDIDFKISLLEIIGNGDYNHRDILGSILGLGISRDVVGDIIINNKVYVIVSTEIVEFIVNNLLKIRNSHVEAKNVSLDLIKDVNNSNYKQEEIIVSSMRLDVILSRVLHLSREKAKEYITLGNVKINGDIVYKIDYICKIEDRLSLSRRGRVIIKNILKTTKKDKLVLSIDITM